MKSKHLHHPHHWPIFHIPCPHFRGKSNGRERQAAVNDGGVRITGASVLWQLATLAINKVRQNNLRTLVWELLAVCTSVYLQLLKQQGGATTAELMQSRKIRRIQCQAASFQWYATSFWWQSSLFPWRLSLFQWHATEYLQWAADFQWWMRDVIQVTQKGVWLMLLRGIG